MKGWQPKWDRHGYGQFIKAIQYAQVSYDLVYAVAAKPAPAVYEFVTLPGNYMLMDGRPNK